MKATIILALICLLVPPAAQEPNGEAEAEARARYEVIAQSIANEAGHDTTLALFMLTIAKHESDFKRDIHSGDVLGDGGWAWGMYQFNNSSHHPEMALRKNTNRQMLYFGKARARQHHVVGVSPKATMRATAAAAFYLRPIISRCNGAPMCVFMIYGGVRRPIGKTIQARLDARVATYGLLQREPRR